MKKRATAGLPYPGCIVYHIEYGIGKCTALPFRGCIGALSQCACNYPGQCEHGAANVSWPIDDLDLSKTIWPSG